MVGKSRTKELDTGSKFILGGITSGVALGIITHYTHLLGGEFAGSVCALGLGTTVTSALTAAKKGVNFWVLANKNPETIEQVRSAGNWALVSVTGMSGLYTTTQVPTMCELLKLNNFQDFNATLLAISAGALVVGAGMVYRKFMRVSEIEDNSRQ